MIRFAKTNELSQLKYIWKKAFDDTDKFIDWNFEKNFCFGNTVVAEKDGKIVSNMQLMPHKILLRGKPCDTSYISGVATLPEFRNMGLVRSMFSFSFKEMKKRSCPVSILIPFNYEFYEKFGYIQCYSKQYKRLNYIPNGRVFGEDADIPELIPVLDTIYKQEMGDKHGYALRTKNDWQKILEDLLTVSGGRIIMNGSIGYAALFPCSKGGWEAEEVCGDFDIDLNPEIKPHAMARIINPLPILKNMAEDFKGSLSLEITDESIKDNNLKLLLENGKITSTDASCDFVFDIKELTQLIFGFCTDRTGLFTKQNNYLRLIF